MKAVSILLLLLLSLGVFAQSVAHVLATASGKTFTMQSLSPASQELYQNREKRIQETRTRLLSEMISRALLELEARSQNRSVEQVLESVRGRIPAPTDAQVQAVYDANRTALGGRPISQVREQIISFLRSTEEQKAIQGYVSGLEAKYKVTRHKDVNSPDLRSVDTLAIVGPKTITAGVFEEKNRLELADAKAEIYEELRADLEASILSALATEEARERGVDVADLIAAEVTNKLREYTDLERTELESAFQRRLFAKYNVRILLSEPDFIVQHISTDDDPFIGKPSAPVTVVMFTDFQCPACARTHPILKKVLTEYGDRARLVVRDFPLRNIHEHALQAAVAANAANKQGKFIEYIEILYRNQDNLDKTSLVEYARRLGLNLKQFELDLTDPKAAAEIRKDIIDGNSYGSKGTPTIFVNGVKVYRLSAEGFRRAIDRALKR